METARKNTPHPAVGSPAAQRSGDWKSPATPELLENLGPLALLDPLALLGSLEHLKALGQGCGWSGKDMAIQTT